MLNHVDLWHALTLNAASMLAQAVFDVENFRPCDRFCQLLLFELPRWEWLKRLTGQRLVQLEHFEVLL